MERFIKINKKIFISLRYNQSINQYLLEIHKHFTPNIAKNIDKIILSSISCALHTLVYNRVIFKIPINAQKRFIQIL